MTNSVSDRLLDAGWAPLYETVIWVFFLTVFIWMFRNRIVGLVETVRVRIWKGATLKVGSFELSSPPADMASGKTDVATSEGGAGTKPPEDVRDMLERKMYPTDIQEEYYLIHEVEVLRAPVDHRDGLYRVRIWLETEHESTFKECKRVVYRLHDTFSTKVISTEAQGREFELWLKVYGEFTIVAYVIREGKEPVWLSRYLELPGRPLD